MWTAGLLLMMASSGAMGWACEDSLEACIVADIVTTLDRLVRMPRVVMWDGVELQASEETVTEPPLSLDTLPRAADDRQTRLYAMALAKIQRLLETHTLRLDPASFRGAGNRLKKMMFPFVVGIALKVAAMLPVLLLVMAGIGSKALMSGKAALLITLLMGFKKLFGNMDHQKHVALTFSDPTPMYHAPAEPYFHGRSLGHFPAAHESSSATKKSEIRPSAEGASVLLSDKVVSYIQSAANDTIQEQESEEVTNSELDFTTDTSFSADPLEREEELSDIPSEEYDNPQRRLDTENLQTFDDERYVISPVNQ